MGRRPQSHVVQITWHGPLTADELLQAVDESMHGGYLCGCIPGQGYVISVRGHRRAPNAGRAFEGDGAPEHG